MALNTMIKKLADSRRVYEAQLAELGKDAKDAVVAHLGAAIPPGFALTWVQYTPGFNDGEPCRFGVHSPTAFRIPEKAEGEEDDDDFDDTHPEEIDGGLDIKMKNYGRDHTTSGTHHNGQPWSYTQEAEPVVDGLSIEAFETLRAAWDDLDYDLLEKAFGDGARVRIEAGGASRVSDYDCGY